MCEFIEALSQKVKTPKKWVKALHPDLDVFGRLRGFDYETICSLQFHSSGMFAAILYDGTLNGRTMTSRPYAARGWQIDVCNPNFNPKKFIKVYNKILNLIPKVHLASVRRMQFSSHAFGRTHNGYVGRARVIFLGNMMDAISQVIQNTLERYKICYTRIIKDV